MIESQMWWILILAKLKYRHLIIHDWSMAACQDLPPWKYLDTLQALVLKNNIVDEIISLLIGSVWTGSRDKLSSTTSLIRLTSLSTWTATLVDCVLSHRPTIAAIARCLPTCSLRGHSRHLWGSVSRQQDLPAFEAHIQQLPSQDRPRSQCEYFHP